MPEVHFEVRWPDGTRQRYYSPSTVVRAHIAAGERYSLHDFIERARTAMQLASERVRAKYGYACSSAMDTLAQIVEMAARFAQERGASVEILEVEDPTPGGSQRRRRGSRWGS